jgi:hypothetical protein
MIFDLNMNKMKTLLLSLVGLSISLAVSCNKDSNTTSSISTSEVTNTINSGFWRITYYWDTDHDETANFSGYVFSFGAGNILTAIINTSPLLPVHWSVGS